jgi:uncharacterized RDD family membrane protein YckC
VPPPHASLLKRVAAAIVDAIPVVPIAVFLAVLLGSGEMLFDASARVGAGSDDINDAYGGLFFALLVVNIVYSTTLEIRTGTTPGKWLFGIAPLDSVGRRETGGRALMRNIAKFASVYFLFAGVLWALIDRRNQMWHDLMVGVCIADVRAIARA